TPVAEAPVSAPAATPVVNLPESNLVQTAMANGNFSQLIAALKAAGLDSVLGGSDEFTVFAPTDEAFAALGEGTIEDLFDNKEKLTSILTYHVIKGKIPAKDVLDTNSLDTVNGAAIPVSSDGGAKIGDANITQTDIKASNGIIHVIDKVLIPGM
ncbi:MAG: fasciclin domain-containing protein, partial [Myxococcota bacterium]